MVDLSDAGGESLSADHTDWRGNVEAQRKLSRDVVMAAAAGGRPLEAILDEVRRQLEYETMRGADRNRLSVLFSDMRTIAGAWPELSYRQRTMFEAGSLVPSTLAKLIRHARLKP
jgi:hypothetical protein